MVSACLNDRDKEREKKKGERLRESGGGREGGRRERGGGGGRERMETYRQTERHRYINREISRGTQRERER